MEDNINPRKLWFQSSIEVNPLETYAVDWLGWKGIPLQESKVWGMSEVLDAYAYSSSSI
jgi:hypothetical protein